jgi:hypothetical protein
MVGHAVGTLIPTAPGPRVRPVVRGRNSRLTYVAGGCVGIPAGPGTVGTLESVLLETVI